MVDERYQPQSAGLDAYSPERQAQLIRMIGAERGASPNQLDAIRSLAMANPNIVDNIAQRYNVTPASQYSGDPNNPGELFGFLGPGPDGNGKGPIVKNKSGGGESGKTPIMPKGHKTIIDQSKEQKRKKVIDDSRTFLADSQKQNPITGNPSEGVDWAQAALIGGGAAGAGAAGYGAYRALRGRPVAGGAGVSPDANAEAAVMRGSEVVPVNRANPDVAVAASMNPRNGLMSTVDSTLGDGITDAEFSVIDPKRVGGTVPNQKQALSAPPRQLPPPEAQPNAQEPKQLAAPKSQTESTVDKSLEEDDTPKKKAPKRKASTKASAKAAAEGASVKGAKTRLKR